MAVYFFFVVSIKIVNAGKKEIIITNPDTSNCLKNNNLYAFSFLINTNNKIITCDTKTNNPKNCVSNINPVNSPYNVAFL